jgi:hypothetical protein
MPSLFNSSARLTPIPLSLEMGVLYREAKQIASLSYLEALKRQKLLSCKIYQKGYDKASHPFKIKMSKPNYTTLIIQRLK